MYKRIVVALDGSPTSDRALDEAIGLGRQHGAELLLLHVTEEPLPLTGEAQWVMLQIPPEVYAKIGEELLERARLKVVQAGLEVEVKRVDAAGRRMGKVIAEQAGHWRGDLLVIGTHGRRGIDRLLLGSVAEAVIRAADMPVLLIRGD